MDRAFLVLRSSQGERRVLVEFPIVIGRALDCGIPIEDSEASRRHLRVTPKGDSFFWQDLGSTNGTRVNGVPMLEGELKHGDVIEVGLTAIRFELEQQSSPSRKSDPEGTPVFLETVLDASGTATTAPAPGKTAELLHAVCALTNAIASNYDPCGLVDQILSTVNEAIQAHRAAMFFSHGARTDLHPCPVCGQIHVIEDGELRHAEPGEIEISKTVAQRVLEGGESVLFQDTAEDGELQTAESILALNLRSIICVPVRGKRGPLGILYMDTDRASHQYDSDDMLLTTAAGNSAGLALENARMHQQLLENQRTEQEIEHAWTIQEGFLVKEWPVQDALFQVYGKTVPAKTVGGDFYDFITISERLVGLLIGDVSGKGVPAALTMAQLLAEFRLHARAAESPAAVLAALNDGFVSRSRRGTFCTLCYLTIDLGTGVVRCANAGHHPGIRITPSGSELMQEASGPPVGILPATTWEDTHLPIDPGDAILLYTDGIVEARAAVTTHEGRKLAQPDEYGIESLCESTGRLYGQSPREIIEAINEEVTRYCAPALPHDDRTMIALRYLAGN